ncbi:Ribokinase [Serinicoccus hydrothermalis]|uniref:Ribokinase n=1 Tax=Serinicoccus hydrothermalis TaxID=1758689 RepID=A0A1B1N9A8_9MICO|nr:PfkB family carbohydrate kinase [Serinicoccus hydrothermalis]ANS77998.1 Ribokinase [Serinicoccus hydrothermalis]
MTQTPRRVIHTGQAMVDLVLEVGSLPARGGNVMADRATRYAGGAVTIVVAAARSGAPAVLAGAVGTGPNGDLVREVLAGEEVEVSAPPVEDLDTGVCVVLVEPSAERTFVTTRAAERRITTDSLATSAAVTGDLVCLSGYTLFEPTRHPLLAWLEGIPEGVDVVLDPGEPFATFDADLVERVLARTTVWTSNAAEARALLDAPSRSNSTTGFAAMANKSEVENGQQGTNSTIGFAAMANKSEVENGEEGTGDTGVTGGAGVTGGVGLAGLCEAVAGRLPEGAVVVVRDGPEGCVVRADGVTTRVPGFPQTPVDTNGAGDTHTGVLCAGVAQGRDWVEAARRANAAAAIKVTRRGPATAPTAEEVDDFLASR